MTYHLIRSHGTHYELVGKGHCRNGQDALYCSGLYQRVRECADRFEADGGTVVDPKKERESELA